MSAIGLGLCALPLLGMAVPPVPASSAAWTLAADGLIHKDADGKPHKLAFGQTRGAAIAAVTAVSGKPLVTGIYPDCGQGTPMGHADFRGGLSLLFLKGRFTGWEVGDKGDPMLRTARGIGIGSTRAALKAAYPGVEIAEDSLGVLFSDEGAPSGFLDEDSPKGRVASLYAGETCAIS
ncbi:hypothetical protein [Sphingomonas sp. KR3-1]|uniref:hypothetical protein n=1 Tax=Sphingomonas sp. KR3-1 TaxID=3156611 RepID=UPI0032B511F7